MARANECEDEFSIMHDVWKQGLRDQVEKVGQVHAVFKVLDNRAS